MFRLQRATAAVMVALGLLAACSDDTPAVVNNTSSTARINVIPGTTFAVSGTVEQAAGNAAVSDPVAVPFTITVPERGVGGAEIKGATAAGKAVQINWEGGQPLPISGSGGGLRLNAATVRIDAKGIVWAIDGATREFLPGEYTLGSSVAVGVSGLARPVDRQAFTADDDTTLTSAGNAAIAVSPRAIRIEGQDSLLVLTGRLTLSGRGGDQQVRRLNFGPGNYEVTLTPVTGGYRVDARLEGPVRA